MLDYATGQIETIDERIRQSTVKYTKMGTVTGRDFTGARCMVIFDGSSGVAQPVKCPESVIVAQGDRVGLVRFESDWTVVANHSLQTLTNAMATVTWGSALTTTSGTYVDMPTSPSVSFVKTRDLTLLRIWVGVSLFSTVAPTVFQLGMHLTSGDLTVSYDETLFNKALNAASNHSHWSGFITTAALHSDGYTATARWLRVSGTGTLTVDTNDSISMQITEVVS